MKIKTINKIIFLLLMIGFFCFPIVLRSAILPNSIICTINPFYILAIILTLIVNLHIFSDKGKIKKRDAGIYLCIMLMLLIELYSNRDSLHYSVYGTICLVLPCVLLTRKEILECGYFYLRKALEIFNITIIFMALYGVVNLFLDGKVFSLLGEFLGQGDNVTRLWSIYGHPLFNVYLSLLFYILNFFNNRIQKKILSYPVIVVVSILNILFSASKTGIVLLAVLLIATNFKNIKYTAVSILTVVVAYFAGLFDVLIARFTGTSLSTGRFSTYQYLGTKSYFKDNMFFSGYGTGYEFRFYSNYLSWASVAYEFPILAFSLNYGYLYTILVYMLTVVYPSIIMLKRKQILLLICFLVLVVDLNTFNAITLLNDYFFVFIITIMIILHISDALYIKEGRNYK